MSFFGYYFAWELINISLEYTAAAWLKLPHFLLVVIAANLLTHPIFTLFLIHCGHGVGMMFVAEIIIFVVEAVMMMLIYGRNRWKIAMLAAFLMNALSLGTGLLLDVKP